MKLKAPKTWQLIVILISVFVLAIGGSFLAVYLTTGFEAKKVVPQEITVESEDKYNASLNQFETVEDFQMIISSPTESVTEKEVTLSFKQGISVTKSEGKISDGIIIVPEKVTLGKTFTVSLVQENYYDKDGEIFISNKGGISELVITTQNNLLSSSVVKIAVDVPVEDIDLKIYNSTTGDELGDELMTNGNKVAEKTNFVIEPVFYPEKSKYLFSDDKNSAIAQDLKRVKNVYYSLGTSVSGIEFVYNDNDVYFIAGDEPSSLNEIQAFVFADASQQQEFLELNNQLSGLPLYSEAIRYLSSLQNSIKSNILVNVVEANVGSFAINDTSGTPFNMVTNKLFRVSAGTSSLSDDQLNIRIRDVHDNDLSSMIKNVGLRIISITDSATNSQVALSSGVVVVKGGEIFNFDGKDYVLINSDVKNLNHAYWEISTTGEYSIVAEIVLLLQNEKGETFIYNSESDDQVYFISIENVDQPVYWDENLIDDNISMTIIYDNNGNVVSSQYKDNLTSVSFVPETNTYQKRMFFVYYDGTLQGDLSDYIAVTNEGKGIYQVNGENKTLYPLIGTELIAKKSINCNLVFATIRTDAYGNPIMSASNTYIIEQMSNVIFVTVKETLQGFVENGVGLIIDENFLIADSNVFAVPTGTNSAITLKLTLKEGDEAIFESELERIEFYASEDNEGKLRRDDIFDFGDPDLTQLEDRVVLIPVNVKQIEITEEKGQDFYIQVAYNNTITTNTWWATPVGEDGKDYYGAIKIYNQTPAQIINEQLENKEFDAIQTLNIDGSGSLLITDNVAGGFETNNISVFNQMLKDTVIKDTYGRTFDSNYNISSSDMNYVIVNDAEKNITFGNGNKNGVMVTVTAGSQYYKFTINVQSIGVTDIEIEGTSVGEENLGNPKYSVSGNKGQNFILKNDGSNNGLLSVYVGNGDKYQNDKYKITVSETFLTTVNESFWQMFKINGQEQGFIPSVETEIDSVEVYQNFGQDVTIPFTASNTNKTLNFTLSVTFTKYAYDDLNNLNAVDYGGNIIGVRQQDIGDNSSEGAIYVYSGFDIDLETYLKATQVNWREVYPSGANYQLTNNNINGGTVIASIDNGVITFNEVYEKTTYIFTLYAYEYESNGNMVGNPYAYNKELTITVCPNFELLPTATPVSLYAISGENQISAGNHLEIKRITKDETKTEDINKLSFDGYSIENYVKIENNYFKFNGNTMFLDYGETEKTVEASLIKNDKAVAFCELKIVVGLTDLGDSGEWLNNHVLYNDLDMIFISERNLTFNSLTYGETDNASGLKVSLAQNSVAYSITGLNPQTISFKNDQNYSVGENYYLYVFFNYAGGTAGLECDVAAVKMPIFISAVGDKFLTYGNDGEDLKNVIDGQNYDINIEAGKSYQLTAPDKLLGSPYVINDQGQLIIFNGATVVGQNMQIELDGQIYSYSISNNLLKTINDVDINKSQNQYFEFLGETYYIESIDSDILSLRKGTIGIDGTITLESVDYGYSVKQSYYGYYLSEFDGTKYLTNFNQNDSESISFSVPNQFSNVMSITNNVLTIKDVIYSEDAQQEILPVYILFTQRDGKTISYNFNISILPNAQIAQVVYPFDGSMEILTILNNESLVVNMKALFGYDTEHYGEVRLPDKLIIGDSEVEITEGRSLEVKEVWLGETQIQPTDSRFSVSCEGDIITFTNRADVSNVKVIVTRKYQNIYGGDLDYVFSINSSNVVYFVDYTGFAEGSFNSSSLTWELNESENSIKVITKQKNEAGESSVDTNRVVTYMTSSFNDSSGFTLTYDYKTGELNITKPDFIATDSTYKVYFQVNGQIISTLNVFVPATVTVSYKRTELEAGGSYDLADIATLPDDSGYSFTNIEIPEGNDRYIKFDGQKLVIENLTEDKKLVLTLIYADNGDDSKTGYDKQTFTITPNVTFEEEFTVYDVIAGETKELDIVGNIITLSNGEIDSSNGKFVINSSIKDTNLIESISLTNLKLNIKTYYVPTNTPTSVDVTFTYVVGENAVEENAVGGNEGLFSFTTTIYMTITTAVKLAVNYPNPSSSQETLSYESIESGTLINSDFFMSPANFAEGNRLAITENSSSISGNPGGASNAEPITITLLSCNNIIIKIEDETSSGKEYKTSSGKNCIGQTLGSFTVSCGTESGVSQMVLQLEYKGVICNYTIACFEKVITGTKNATINYVVDDTGEYEKIFVDRTIPSALFAKDRLVQIQVSSNASVGSVYAIYKGDEKLTTFLMKEEYKGRNIFVDCGKSISLKDDEYLLFKNEAGTSAMTGVTFVRTASRVEFSYTTIDGTSILIKNEDLIIDDPTEGGIKWKNGKANCEVKYTIGPETTSTDDTEGTETITDRTVLFTFAKSLDIDVELEFNENSPTAIEIQTNALNKYRLVDLAGIYHPSTGEKLSRDLQKNVSLSLEVVNTTGEGTEHPTQFNNENKFAYQTAGGLDYLTFANIANDNNTIYDYFLFAEGSPNEGIYVLVKFTYTVVENTVVENTVGEDADGENAVVVNSEEFYIAFHIVPDYQVTINGTVLATPGVVNEGVSNSEKPYNFVPDGKKSIILANAANDGNQLISFVRKNWNSTNIANSLNYTITVEEDGVGYNNQINMNKLGFKNPPSSWTVDETYSLSDLIKNQETGGTSQGSGTSQETGGTSQGSGTSQETGGTSQESGTNSSPNDFMFTPSNVVFGEKKFKIVITNDYGYEIEFYFVLVPEATQTPAVYEAASTSSFTEGESFDIGLVYDVISVENIAAEGKPANYVASVLTNNIPLNAAIKTIILQNIDAWGVTAALSTLPENVTFDKINGIANTKYAAAPTIKDVTIQSISFRYGDSTIETVDKASGKSLATDKDLKYPPNVTLGSRGLAETFTVPTMPGWIYGTGDSATITVVVTLAYKAGGTSQETCEVSYQAVINKNLVISAKQKVAVDSVEFSLGDYISVKEKLIQEGEQQEIKPAFYDDTLEVTVPENGGQVSLTITFNPGETNEKIVTKTLNNTNTERAVTEYLYLSELYGKTLTPNDSISIEWTSVGTGASVRYANREIGPGNPFSLTQIENDTLYIEDAGRILNNEYYLVTQAYVIEKTEGQFYQYRHTYYLTSRYSYLDDGLGQATYKTITTNENSGSDKVSHNQSQGYIVPFSIWASGIKVAVAKDGSNGITADDYELLINKDIDLKAFKFVINTEETDSTASIGDENVLITGADYKPDNNQYILINIYVKASGGAAKSFGDNQQYDKYLGRIRIFLSANGNQGTQEIN